MQGGNISPHAGARCRRSSPTPKWLQRGRRQTSGSPCDRPDPPPPQRAPTAPSADPAAHHSLYVLHNHTSPTVCRALCAPGDTWLSSGGRGCRIMYSLPVS